MGTAKVAKVDLKESNSGHKEKAKACQRHGEHREAGGVHVAVRVRARAHTPAPRQVAEQVQKAILPGMSFKTWSQ